MKKGSPLKHHRYDNKLLVYMSMYVYVLLFTCIHVPAGICDNDGIED